MIADTIAIINFIAKLGLKARGLGTITAKFKWDGTRVFGSQKIVVERHMQENGTWYYTFNELEDYVFLRMPVNLGGVIEDIGTAEGESNANAKFFRYIAVPDGTIRGSPIPNVKVDFTVVGYKLKEFLKIVEIQR